LSVALGNRFHTRSNNLSEDKLVNRCWSLLCCMLPCFMLPGTRGKAVRVCARSFLDRFSSSDLFLVAALRSASRSLLALSFAGILVRPFSGTPLECALTSWMYWLRRALPCGSQLRQSQNLEVISRRMCTCTKRGGGWGPIHFRYFLWPSRRYNARPSCDTSEVKLWAENYL
jgi:hypothetical protein